jgi:PAS domain S-box-containing protein
MSDDFLSEIFDQLTEGVATLTAEGAVASWNPEAASLTGYSLLEINAIGLAQIFETPGELKRLIQAAEDGTPTLGERLILKRADGQRVSIDVRCSPLRHIEQAQGRHIVVMRDLSELEALQNRLMQSERLSLLGRMAGSVSHEIRNPLSAIFLHVNILEDEFRQLDVDGHDQIVSSLTAIKDEVTRVHEMVQQYLSLARLSELHREPVDMRTYLEAFGSEIQTQLQSHNITWELKADLDLGQVALHRNSFRRVLLNLLNNAIEAMPQGGVLTLRCQRLSDQVQIEFCDAGCGISADQLPFLFQPLHSSKPEGTGLGLYLAREIVHAHQGDIVVASEPNVGTIFTISLPLLPAQPMPAIHLKQRISTDVHNSNCG